MKYDHQWFNGISSIVRENDTERFFFFKNSVIIAEFKLKAEK